jgi:hypothetical protein
MPILNYTTEIDTGRIVAADPHLLLGQGGDPAA